MHAQLCRTAPHKAEPILLVLRRRTAAVYPPYAFSLLLALVVDWWRSKALPSWYIVASQAFMLQGLLPWLPERSVQIQAWCAPDCTHRHNAYTLPMTVATARPLACMAGAAAPAR